MWTNNGTQVVVEASLVTSQNVKLIVGRAKKAGKWCTMVWRVHGKTAVHPYGTGLDFEVLKPRTIEEAL